jgi:hypothetical protein
VNLNRAARTLATLMGLSVAALGSGCTSPVQGDGSSVTEKAAKTLAFSYDATLDQFTHMSCTNMPVGSSNSFSTSAYFTYRMGAYNQGGLTLKDSFYTSLKKFKFDQQAEILAASSANTNTVLQLAMRGRLDYQNLYLRTGSNAAANQDYWNMLTTLGSSETAQTLVNNPAGSRVKFLRNGNPGGYRLEGSLYFSDNSAMVQATRDFLSGRSSTTGLLTMTYTNGTTKAKSPADVDTSTSTSASPTPTPPPTNVSASRVVYGRGYAPGFGLPDPTTRTSPSLPATYPANVVTSIVETSLDGSSLSPAPQWSCPSSLQLRIVRAADVGNAGTQCTRKSDPANPSPELKLLRNTLKVEDWYIDLANHCMIPKRAGTDCYGPRNDIVYTMGDACSSDSNGFSNCVQYASTCYRTN